MTKLIERRNDILRALTATVLILATDLAVYYLTKPNSSATHLIDMSIALDDYIPFVPQFVFIYILTFAFWCIAPLIIIRTGIGRFSDFFTTAVISLIICGIFFLLLPATVTRPDIIPATAAERILVIIYDSDAPTNLFPSIHCLLTWICWIAVRRQCTVSPWIRLAVFVFTLLVCASTVLIRQHVIVDFFAAVVVAECVWFFVRVIGISAPARKAFTRLPEIFFNNKR